MTRDDHIKIIREACIKANPEIVVDEIAHYQGEQEPAIEVVTRPIRLADVCYLFRIPKDGDSVRDLHDRLSRIVMLWNLFEDNLNDQVYETVSFISGLLKENV